MEEANRLVCPECSLVYRLKRVVPGKTYNCRQCGSELAPAASGAIGECRSDKAPAARAAGRSAVPSRPPRAVLFETQLERFATLSDALAEHINLAKGADLRDRIEKLENLGMLLHKSSERIGADAAGDGELANRIRELEERLADILAKLDPAGVDSLAELIRETGRQILDSFDASCAGLKADVAELLGGIADGGRVLSIASDDGDPDASGAARTIDLDALAERIVSGIAASSPSLEAESGTVVDALARVADGLVKEQHANTRRLDALTGEIRDTATAVSTMHVGLPDRVADEIGRTVEERVVGPISTALARQAPAILSELQDNKLVDIVSRSVREAQRPLLREVLAGGRGGVPIWLFASVLLPLLIILGYLFLPGSMGGGEEQARLESGVAAVADSLHRLEAGGVPVAGDAAERLRNIEEVVVDLHAEAMTHAKNAAALEEEAKGLRDTLGERDRLIKEYSEMLQRQVRRIRAYETHLTRLGVSPDSVEE